MIASKNNYPKRYKKKQQRLKRNKRIFLKYMFVFDLCGDHVFTKQLIMKRFNFTYKQFSVIMAEGFKYKWKL